MIRYTGFRDSRGQKIFTGDIIAVGGSVFRVEGTTKKYVLVNEWDKFDQLDIAIATERGRVTNKW